MVNKYAAVLVAALVSGCGPQYKTEYSYVRPTTPEGQSCVFQCQNSELLCNQNLNLKVESCESRASASQLTYDLCVKNNEGKSAEDKAACSFPTYEFCGNERDNHQSCKITYNQCYANCGGEVSSETICTANCD